LHVSGHIGDTIDTVGKIAEEKNTVLGKVFMGRSLGRARFGSGGFFGQIPAVPLRYALHNGFDQYADCALAAFRRLTDRENLDAIVTA
jgi:hypothetical protein